MFHVYIVNPVFHLFHLKVVYFEKLSISSEIKTMESYKYSRRRRKERRWEWKKQPGYPKRPLSAYNCFYRDERMRMLDEIPMNKDRGGLTGMSKLIGQRWKVLSTAMKHPYEMEAHAEKAKYEKKVRLFKVQTLLNYESGETTVVSTIDGTEPTNSNQSHSSDGHRPSVTGTEHSGCVGKKSCIISPASCFKVNVLTKEPVKNQNIPFNPVSGGTTRCTGSEQFDMSSMYHNLLDHTTQATYEIYCNTVIDGSSFQVSHGHGNATVEDQRNRNKIILLTDTLSGDNTVPPVTDGVHPKNYSRTMLGMEQQQQHKQELDQNSCDAWDCESITSSVFFDNDFSCLVDSHAVPTVRHVDTSQGRKDKHEPNCSGDNYQS
jgi:HMG (high mobility group) box